MSDAVRAVRRIFADAGLTGCAYAASLARPDQHLAVDADEAMPLASLYKLVLLVTYGQAVDDSVLDPGGRVTLRPATRAAGSTGIALFQDPVTLSWRDCALSMVAVSDNAAAGALYDRLGPDRIRATIDGLGLRSTRVGGDSRAELRALMAGTGSSTAAEAFARVSDAARPTDLLRSEALTTSSSTAREISAVLEGIWADSVASPEQCAVARWILGQRYGPLRLRLGFPFDQVAVAEKSATLGALRHSAGVVEFGAAEAYVVTVLTLAARSDRILPAAEAAIGAAAAALVDALRTRSRSA